MKIGVLGGIGVEATGYFYTQLMSRLQNSGIINSNTDYPQVIINSINAPELHLEEHDKEEILKPYVDGIKDLVSLKPDIIVMVCNTIHLFIDKIKSESEFNDIYSLKEAVCKHIHDKNPKAVCVLGTGLTITRGLYDYDTVKYLNPTAEEYKIICEAVTNFNAGGNKNNRLEINKSKLLDIIYNKQKQGVDLFLFACTEVSEILHYSNINHLDTLEVLIDEVVSICIKNKKKAIK